MSDQARFSWRPAGVETGPRMPALLPFLPDALGPSCSALLARMNQIDRLSLACARRSGGGHEVVKMRGRFCPEGLVVIRVSPRSFGLPDLTCSCRSLSYASLTCAENAS